MARNLIIYDKNKEVKFNKDYMTTNNDIYMIYDGKVFNPPYFDTIILCRKDLSDEEKEMVWNMVRQNGKLITYTRDIEYFKKYNNHKDELKINDKMTEIKKLDYTKDKIIKNKYRTFDFGIIGTQKGGTTSLLINLGKHKEISMSKEEDHIFDILLGRKKIQESVNELDKSKLMGFKNPAFMYLSNNHAQLQKFSPQVKLIVVLRNPVNRAYSHWNMIFNDKTNNYNKSFEDAISEEKTHRLGENKTFYTAGYHFLQRGLYYKQLIQLYKYFNVRNILVIISEKMFENPDKYYKKICEFLNIKYDKIDYSKERVGNYKEKLGNAKYNELINFFREDIQNLEKLINEKTNWI